MKVVNLFCIYVVYICPKVYDVYHHRRKDLRPNFTPFPLKLPMNEWKLYYNFTKTIIINSVRSWNSRIEALVTSFCHLPRSCAIYYDVTSAFSFIFVFLGLLITLQNELWWMKWPIMFPCLFSMVLWRDEVYAVPLLFYKSRNFHCHLHNLTFLYAIKVTSVCMFDTWQGIEVKLLFKLHF